MSLQSENSAGSGHGGEEAHMGHGPTPGGHPAFAPSFFGSSPFGFALGDVTLPAPSSDKRQSYDDEVDSILREAAGGGQSGAVMHLGSRERRDAAGGERDGWGTGGGHDALPHPVPTSSGGRSQADWVRVAPYAACDRNATPTLRPLVGRRRGFGPVAPRHALPAATPCVWCVFAGGIRGRAGPAASPYPR